MLKIELLGIVIQEPMAALTDFLVALMCFISFSKINSNQTKNKVFVYYKYYFLFLGIALFLAGLLGHALLNYIDIEWKLPGWLLSMFAIFAIEQAAIEQFYIYSGKRVSKYLKLVNFTVLIILAFLSFYYLDFFYVTLHSVYGLILVVFSLQMYLYIKTGSKAGFNTMSAIAIALVSVVVFALQLSLHTWFNHIALSHVLLAFSVHYFYKGVFEMEAEIVKIYSQSKR